MSVLQQHAERDPHLHQPRRLARRHAHARGLAVQLRLQLRRGLARQVRWCSGELYPANQKLGRYTPSSTPTKLSQPTCQALYDFEPENAGELGFKEGDIITLKQKVDDNW